MPIHNFLEAEPKAALPDHTGVLRRFIMGLVIGVACITPGLSGGVIAAAAGLYEPALHAITHVFGQFKKSASFLLPLGLGGLAGVLLFSNVMQWLMTIAPAAVLFVFLGLVAGSLPALVREANASGFKKRYLFSALAAFAVVWGFQHLLGGLLPQGGLALNWPGALLSGAVIAFGTIVPGISSSFVLMQLGTYEKMLAALTGLDIPVLFQIALGCGAAALVLVFAADWLFRHFRGYAYYAVIGFLAASIVTVFPGFSRGAQLMLDIALFAASAAVCYRVMQKAPEEP